MNYAEIGRTNYPTDKMTPTIFSAPFSKVGNQIKVGNEMQANCKQNESKTKANEKQEIASVTVFRSFVEAISAAIKDDAEKGRIYEAIMRYALDGIEPDLDGVSAALFALMKPNIDKSVTRKISGRNGGAKPKQTENKTETTEKQNESKTKANEKQTLREEEEEEEEEVDTLPCGRVNTAPAREEAKYPETVEDVIRIAQSPLIGMRCTNEQADAYLTDRQSKDWIPFQSRYKISVGAIPADLKKWLVRDQAKNEKKGRDYYASGKHLATAEDFAKGRNDAF